jgi:eukaryotic-like serine/threonine-protein kinase
MRRSVSFLMVCVIAASLSAAEMFRGDAQHSGSYQGQGPLGGIRVEWSFHTEGVVRSSPAVTSDSVYIGSEDGFLYSIDRTSGRMRWKFAAGGPVNSSPAVDGDLVYVNSANGFLNAVRRSDGKLRWRVATSADTTPRWGWEYFASSPAIADGVVYSGAPDGRVRALDAARGRTKWTSDALGTKIISSPAIAKDLVVIGSDSGRLFALDKATGRPRWTFESEGVHIDSVKAGFDRQAIVASPAIREDEVVIGARDGFLYGVSLQDGKERWRIDHHVFWVVASAAIWHDTALVGTSDAKSFESVDRKGHVRWSVPVPDRIFSSAAIAGDVAYVGCHDGSLFAFDAASGKQLWRFWIGAPITSSPVVRDGVVYAGADDGTVYALSGRPSIPSIQHRAVFFQDVPPIWFRESARVRDYALSAGFEVLDGPKLAAFMRDRIADHELSVVLFAVDRVPAEVGADPSPDSLLARYIAGGGRVAWTGVAPYLVVFDATTGRPKGVDPARTAAFLGVSLENAGHDDLPVRANAAGRGRGLAGWWVGSGGVAAQGLDEVLAADDYGRAVTWLERIGSGDFVMIGGGQTTGMDLVNLIRLVESR